MKTTPGAHTIALHQSQSKVPVTLPLREVCVISTKFDDNRQHIFKAEACEDFRIT